MKKSQKTALAIFLVLVLALAVSFCTAGSARADEPCDVQSEQLIAQPVYYEEHYEITPVETTMEYGPAYYLEPLEEELRVARNKVSELEFKVSSQQLTIQRLRDKLRNR